MIELNGFELKSIDQIREAKLGDVFPISNPVHPSGRYYTMKGLISAKEGNNLKFLAKDYFGIYVEFSIQNFDDEDTLSKVTGVVCEDDSVTMHYQFFAYPIEEVRRGNAAGNTFKEPRSGDPRVSHYKKIVEEKNAPKKE